jgi:hypothetical protein
MVRKKMKLSYKAYNSKRRETFRKKEKWLNNKREKHDFLPF